MIDDVLKELQTSIVKAHEALKRELSKLRTGRANAAMLDGVRIDYYGTPTPLNQMANVSVPEPRLIIVKPWDRSQVKIVDKAIRDADAVTRERREAELHARAEAAVAHAKSLKKGKRTTPRPLPVVSDDGQPVRYPLRAFVQTWGELANWWTHYDAATLAAELTDEQFDNFLATVEGTTRFAETLHTAREDTAARPRLRAL